jgi:predicted 2-oxoglutarate/Fe(II)-dependent dioxygenase YbiX
MTENILFSKDECQFLRKLVKDNDFKQSKVISSNTNKVLQNVYRTSTECILKIDEDLRVFLLKKLNPLGVKTLPDEFSVLRYEKNQEFKIHTDSDINRPEIYKTIIIQLSDDDEYTGGELCVFLNKNKFVASKKIGNVIIFNSSLEHCANKIEKGTRHSMVLFLQKCDFDVSNNLI